MSKSRIEKYIPDAIKVLDTTFLNTIRELYPEIPNGAIPREYNGYISSFGASVMQSGLKPTLALFENSTSKTDKAKRLLTTAILEMLPPKRETESLLRYVLDEEREHNIQNDKYLSSEIMDIAIALKLSIRTYELYPKGEEDE